MNTYNRDAHTPDAIQETFSLGMSGVDQGMTESMENVFGHESSLRMRQNKPDLRRLVYKRQGGGLAYDVPA